MKIFRPDRSALTSLRVITALIAVFFIVAAKIYIPVNIIITILSMAFAVIVIFMDFVYYPLYFGSMKYEITNEQITRYSGVFFKSRKSVNFLTVQYTASVTTPFSRYTGLNFGVLFVYGGQLELMFLSYSDASEIIKIVESCGKGEKADVS